MQHSVYKIFVAIKMGLFQNPPTRRDFCLVFSFKSATGWWFRLNMTSFGSQCTTGKFHPQWFFFKNFEEYGSLGRLDETESTQVLKSEHILRLRKANTLEIQRRFLILAWAGAFKSQEISILNVHVFVLFSCVSCFPTDFKAMSLTALAVSNAHIDF